MKETRNTEVGMECVTLETDNQGNWRVVSVERRPLFGSILRMIIAGLLGVSAFSTAITVLFMSWVVIVFGVVITDSGTDRVVSNIFIPLVLILLCVIVVVTGITVAKGIDVICHRECFVLTYTMILGLSPILWAIYAVNFIGPSNDIILFLKIMLMKISMEHFLYGAFEFIGVNGIAVLLALVYGKFCIQESKEAIHEDAESEAED